MDVADSLGAAVGLDFIHIRTRLGLTWRMRRWAIRLKKTINQILEEDNVKKVAVKNGEIANTYRAWDRILDLLMQEDIELEKLTRIEEIELREEEITEQSEEREIEQILDREIRAVQSGMAKLPEDVIRELEALKRGLLKNLFSAKSIIRQLAKKITIEEKDMYQNRQRYYKYWSIFSDKILTKSIRRLVKDEKRLIKAEMEEQHRLDLNLQGLMHAIKKSDERAVRGLIKRINQYGPQIEKSLKKEAQEIAEIIHIVHIIKMHMLYKALNVAPEDFQDLADKGFPAEQLGELEAKHKKLLDSLRSTMLHTYMMARYEQKRA